VLLTHVEPILGVYRAAQADLDALRRGAGATLRIGIADHLAPSLLTHVLPEFLQAHPQAEIEIRESADGGELAALVASGGLDVAVGDPPADNVSLATQILAPEPYVLIAPASWGVVRRAGDDPLALLSHLPLVRPEGDPDAARVEHELRTRGVIASAAITTAAPSSVLALVAAGTGAAVVPASRAVDDPKLVRLPLDGLVAPRNVIAAWHRERRAAPLVAAFVATVAAQRPLAPAHAAPAPGTAVAVAA
jgi:DNA-binding transcriptional LysR family regulator